MRPTVGSNEAHKGVHFLRRKAEILQSSSELDGQGKSPKA
jgi:hypothetical protein